MSLLIAKSRKADKLVVWSMAVKYFLALLPNHLLNLAITSGMEWCPGFSKLFQSPRHIFIQSFYLTSILIELESFMTDRKQLIESNNCIAQNISSDDSCLTQQA